jgi:hypothetical protein
MALEGEICRWNSSAWVLRKDDKEAFGEIAGHVQKLRHGKRQCL